MIIKIRYSNAAKYGRRALSIAKRCQVMQSATQYNSFLQNKKKIILQEYFILCGASHHLTSFSKTRRKSAIFISLPYFDALL
jgi:hypothetical protein